MKIIVQEVDVVRIVAENESDEAILRNLWNGPMRHIEHIEFQIGGFVSKEKFDVAPPNRTEGGSHLILQWQLPTDEKDQIKQWV